MKTPVNTPALLSNSALHHRQTLFPAPEAAGKTPANPRADGTPALPPDLVDGTWDEALDVRPVSEDLRERVAEGGSGLDGRKTDLPWEGGQNIFFFFF